MKAPFFAVRNTSLQIFDVGIIDGNQRQQPCDGIMGYPAKLLCNKSCCRVVEQDNPHTCCNEDHCVLTRKQELIVIESADQLSDYIMNTVFGNGDGVFAIIGRLHKTLAKSITQTGVHKIPVITGKPIATTFSPI